MRNKRKSVGTCGKSFLLLKMKCEKDEFSSFLAGVSLVVMPGTLAAILCP